MMKARQPSLLGYDEDVYETDKRGYWRAPKRKSTPVKKSKLIDNRDKQRSFQNV